MKKIFIVACALCAQLMSMAQPAGGFGGFQMPEVKLETSQSWKDVNYAGDDQAYHTCDIYLPRVEKEAYPVRLYSVFFIGTHSFPGARHYRQGVVGCRLCRRVPEPPFQHGCQMACPDS